MTSKRHIIRTSTFDEIIARNSNRPEKIISIKQNVSEVLSILMIGSTHTAIANYCRLLNKKTVSKSVFYDYLHVIEPILREMVIQMCKENLQKAKDEGKLVVGFDACWAHRRNSHHCLGILINLLDNLIIAFDVTHHGIEEFETLNSTKKNAKCMEKICLESIIENSHLIDIDELIFIHDCDLSDEYLIQEMLPNAEIYFDPNHYGKKMKKSIKKFLVEKKNKILKKLSERIEKFYDILLHDRQTTFEEKKQKWEKLPQHFIECEKWDEEEYEEEIQILKELVDEYIDTFDDVLPCYGTNVIESFNHCRALLANKNMAWRLSWRVRCYISIIKWNSPVWEQLIFQRFDLELPKEAIQYEEKINRLKDKRREIESTDVFKIERAKKKKLMKEKYKLNGNEICLHDYADYDDSEDNTSTESNNKIKKRKEKSKKSNSSSVPETEKWIFEALRSLTKKTGHFISFKKIYDKIVKMHGSDQLIITEKRIKSQLTRLVNNEKLIEKKNTYSLK